MRSPIHLLPLLLTLLPLALTQSSITPSPSAVVPTTVAPSPSATTPSAITTSPAGSTTTSPATTAPTSAGSTGGSSAITTQPATTVPPPGSANSSLISTGISGSANRSITSTSIAPNATVTAGTNTTRKLTVDESDEWMGPDGDETPPPAAFQADEQVLNLVYAANYDKSLCQSLASSYASGSSAMLRRHWAEVAYRRKRQTLPHRCLPAVYTIPVSFHWFPPKGVDPDTWVNSKSLTATILATQNKLGIMNAAMDVRNRWVWRQTDDSNRFSSDVKADLAWSRSYIKSIKDKQRTASYSHLNVFIVQSAGPGLNGFATFPGVAGGKADYAAVVLSAHALLGNKQGSYDATDAPYHGTTMAHEIGHWLGLKHPHDKGCDGNDYERETPQYPVGWGDYTCPDSSGKTRYVGSKGTEEHNIMAYSYGRSIAQGTFGRDQARRAAAGFLMRRSGVGASANQQDGKWYTNTCVNKYRKRDLLTERDEEEMERNWNDILIPRYLPTLDKRQMTTQLQSFCNSTDLGIENYQFSQLAQTGLYNAESPSIPNQPSTGQAQSVAIASEATDTGGEKTNSFSQVQQAVQQRVENNGGAIVDGAAPAVPTEVTKQLDDSRTGSTGTGGTGGTTKSGAERVLAGWGLMGVVLVMIGSMVVLFK